MSDNPTTGWQPIENAPCETDVLLWGVWQRTFEAPEPETCAVGRQWDNGGGWRVRGNSMSLSFQPTHWMPLPEAPQ